MTNAGAAEPARPKPKPKPPRRAGETPGATEALIYLPGLGNGTDDKSVTGVITHLTQALDQTAGTREASWRVEWAASVVTRKRRVRDADDAPTPSATIFRKDGDVEHPVVDVYEYDWSPQLTTPWEKQGIFRRAARVLLSMINLARVWRSFAAARHSTRGGVQLLVATLFLLIMMAYAGTLVVAAGQAVQQIYLHAAGKTSQSSASGNVRPVTVASSSPHRRSSPPAGKSRPAAKKHEKPVTTKVTIVQWIAMLSTIVTLWLKKSGDRLLGAGAALFAAQNYLRVAYGKQEILGGLASLCEKIVGAKRYDNVRVLAYSFGSIVAIDGLYPTSGPPERSMDGVTSLATIGAPYDFVYAVRPRWSHDRHARAAQPAIEWSNFYAPVDLLGSNFRTDNADGEANRGIRPVGGGSDIKPEVNEDWNVGVAMGFADLVMLWGLRSHGMYWGTDDSVDRSVFVKVVPELYKDTDLLR